MRHFEFSEIQIMNYLAGEMNPKEREGFENQLKNNPLIEKQVEEMRTVMSKLSEFSNDSILIPDFEANPTLNNISSGGKTTLFNSAKQKHTVFPNWMKYAASFVGIIIAFQICDLQVNRNGNTLALSFGDPQLEGIAEKDINQTIAKALKHYTEEQNIRMANMKHDINSELLTLSEAVENMSLNNNSQLVRLNHELDSKARFQFTSFEKMLKSIEQSNRHELEHSFTGLIEYIDEKRIEDRFKIQNAFNEVATAINDQQYQTNALFSNFVDVEPLDNSY